MLQDMIPATESKEVSTQELCMGAMPMSKDEHKNVNKDDDTIVIESKGLLDVERIHYEPEGNCIVNLSFFLKELHRFFDNHARGIECQFKDWILVNTRRKGFMTQFFYKCQMCHYEASIWSHPIDDETMDINTALTAGTISSGLGYAQMEEIFAAANIPCMSEKTYIKHREIIIDDFEKTALENMKIAGEMERQLAIGNNEIISSIPYITVVVDGSWAKRSYGTAYDSLSGVGAIIGYRTGKVLFVGVRNKFCTVCHMAEQRKIEAKVHKCYKNFDRNASSARMESDAIVEGFNHSISQHNVIYRTIIADGDSNVYQSIINNKPYQEQNVTVRKVECTNHLLRNLRKKLKKIADTIVQSLRRNREFIKYRNIVRNNIENIVKEIYESAERRRKEQQPQHCQAIELREDILNIPSHIFGEHKRCAERGRTCKDVDNKNIENSVPYLKKYGLYPKIQNAIKYLSAYSDSLLLNVTNNYVELFNSVVCKAIAGKRQNFGARGSYNARIAGAVIQHNTQEVLTKLHKNVCNTVPSIIENLEKRRQIKVARTKEYRKVHGKPDVFEQLKKKQLEKLFEDGRNWKQIECDTREQSKCELWQTLRKERLTSSNFGLICRVRPTTSCAMTVKNILFPALTDTAAMKYGREMEEIAKQDLSELLEKDIKPCGLFIDCDNPYLSASPDGLLDEDGLIEIKCPASAEAITAEEAILTLPRLKGIFDRKDPNVMNRNHRFFYQIQGQLNITRRNYCIFALWTPKSMKTVRVNRDIDFWQNQMLSLLKRFYFECLLPEIVDSRHNRHLPIREPNYIIEAKEKSKSAIHYINKRQHETTTNEQEKTIKM